jgi:hypothetical protein
MLNYQTAMHRTILLLALLFQSVVSIDSPKTGDILRGQVEVSGNMDLPNFLSAELAFGYASDSTDNWFIIQTFSQPVKDTPFAIWDTTSITDGDYKLRLRVYLQDGTFQDTVITDLKIANEVPTPTAVPLNFEPTFTPLPPVIAPATSTPAIPQPTPLPPNPASITIPAIYSMFGRGALVALVIFVLVSLLFRLRKNR